MVAVLSLVANGLVNEVPDKAAAHIIVLFKIVHIFLEVAQAVFHSVSIFAENYGASISLFRNWL